MKELVADSEEYKKFLKSIKERIYRAQYAALKKVNKEHIALCWYIGKKIVEKQQVHNWGKAIVENLSKDLQKDFPGTQGFSTDSLWRMRKFYLHYKDNKKLAPLVQEISWSKNIIIMEKCNDNLEREFYIKMTKKFGWTKNVLIHQIENQSYEKYLLNQTNFDKALPEKYKHQAKLALKDVSKPIGVSTYKISKELPKEIKKYLPSPKEIEKRLSVFTSLEGSKKAGME